MKGKYPIIKYTYNTPINQYCNKLAWFIWNEYFASTNSNSFIIEPYAFQRDFSIKIYDTEVIVYTHTYKNKFYPPEQNKNWGYKKTMGIDKGAWRDRIFSSRTLSQSKTNLHQ